MKRIGLAVLALGSISAARAGVGTAYPPAAALTGSEILGPIRQNGREVTVTVAQLVSQALSDVNSLRIAGLSNFASAAVNPDVPFSSRATSAPQTSLPVATLGCHQVGQVYVASQTCIGAKVLDQTETYLFSINLADLDDGVAPPTSDPGGNNNGSADKVGAYIGVDNWSPHSNVWDQNSTLTLRAGSKGGIGYEFDIGSLDATTTSYGVTAIGQKGKPIGILMTGVPGQSGNSNSMNGPAFVCTSDGGGRLWTDCIAGTGNAIRDNFIEDFTQATSSYGIENNHSFGIDETGAKLSGAGLRLGSGTSSQIGVGHIIEWIPGRGTAGAGTDTIGDSGGGLTLTSDASHSLSFRGANVYVSTGAMFFQNYAKSSTSSPYLQVDPADGNLHLGTATPGHVAGLEVDGGVNSGGSVLAQSFDVDPGGAFNVPATNICATPSGSGPTGACMNFLAGTGTLGSVGLSLNVKSPGNLTNAIIGESVNVRGAAGDAAALYDYNPSVTWPAASTLGGASTEADVGNLSSEPSCGDAPGRTCAQRFGEWLTGISFRGVPGASNGISNPNSAALFVTGQAPNGRNHGTDNNGVVWKQWIDGIRIAGQNATRDNDYYSQTRSTVGITDNGTHTNAIVLNGTYSSEAIQYTPLIGRTYTDLFHVGGGTGAIYTAAGVSAASSQTRVKRVASLSACNAAAEGTRAGVTDATANTFGATAAGGGSYHEPVYCNGTAWMIE